MSVRHKQSTYGQQIDSVELHIERMTEVVKRFPNRTHEIDQGREILAEIKTQMRRLNKRRSAAFYGLALPARLGAE